MRSNKSLLHALTREGIAPELHQVLRAAFKCGAEWALRYPPGHTGDPEVRSKVAEKFAAYVVKNTLDDIANTCYH